MKKWILIAIFWFAFSNLWSQPLLGDQAHFSLLTCNVSDDEPFTIYGHTALRLQNPEFNQDLVFNWGVFDFDTPFFIWRFAKGQTDYVLGVTSYTNFISEYSRAGRKVEAFDLDLTAMECKKLWQLLYENSKPENRTYRYNFFFDNCATRPIMIISQIIDGSLKWEAEVSPKSFRQLINDCSVRKPWLTWGCDLALGVETDRIATTAEQRFLPLNLAEQIQKAKVVFSGGERKLVKKTYELLPQKQEEKDKNWWSPNVVMGGVFFLFLALLVFFRKKEKLVRRLFNTIFILAGLGGCVLFFISFISTHPFVYPNANLFWIHPFYLLIVLGMQVKRFQNMVYWMHFINFALLLVLLLSIPFIEQHFNSASIISILLLEICSGFYIFERKLNR